MADTRPITRLTIKDTETGAETETDVKTCARGVTCDEGKTAQDHISDFVAHKKDVNRHVLVQVGGDEPATGPALWLDEDSSLHYKDKSGIKKDLYPATKAALVEGLSALLTGVKKSAQSDLSSHTSDKNNPHGVTAEQAGADPKGAAAAVQGNLDTHTGNKNNPHNVTCDQIGAAAAEHTHDAGDINSGILPVARGGTGASTAEKARESLEVPSITDLNDVAANVGDWKIAIFRKSTTIKTPSNIKKTAHVIMLGGGGGGGGTYGDKYNNGSGGGGGGHLVEADITVQPSQNYVIEIGAGGTGGTSSTTESAITSGTKGGTTSAFGLSAAGGDGGEKGGWRYGSPGNGGNGGSGGAGGWTNTYGVGSSTGGNGSYGGGGYGPAGGGTGGTYGGNGGTTSASATNGVDVFNSPFGYDNIHFLTILFGLFGKSYTDNIAAAGTSYGGGGGLCSKGSDEMGGGGGYCDDAPDTNSMDASGGGGFFGIAARGGDGRYISKGNGGAGQSGIVVLFYRTEEEVE